MSQVQNIYQYEDYKSISNDNDSYNRFESCEEVVDAIISKGLLNSCDKTSALNKIIREYGLSYQEAKTCYRLASAQVGTESREEEKEDKLYAQSGYYYPGYTQPKNAKAKNDGMDSLSSFGSYNRIMFGLA